MTPDRPSGAAEEGARGRVETAERWVVWLASGQVEREGLDSLRAWLAAEPANREAFEAARATWQAAAALEPAFAEPQAAPPPVEGLPVDGPPIPGARPPQSHRHGPGHSAFDRPPARPVRTGPSAGRTQPSRSRIPVLSAAAIAGLLLVAMLMAGEIGLRLRADARTAAGEQRQLTLADGSTLYLDTDSAVTLRYSAGERRVLLLRGEAFFEVEPNPARPFVVEALDGSIRAVGTAFSVRQDEESVAVAVAEGTVEVESPQAGRASPLRVAAGGRARFQRGEAPLPLPGAAGPVAPWRSGRIVFDGLPFPAAIAELDRYFPGRIVVARSLPPGRLVSGSFSTGEIPGAVRALAETQGLEALQLGGLLLVLR